MEIALSAAAAACSHVSDIASRTDKKVRGKREELRREVMTVLDGLWVWRRTYLTWIDRDIHPDRRIIYQPKAADEPYGHASCASDTRGSFLRVGMAAGLSQRSSFYSFVAALLLHNRGGCHEASGPNAVEHQSTFRAYGSRQAHNRQAARGFAVPICS